MSDSVNEKVRCLIIGSGPAGYTAAVLFYKARVQQVIRQRFMLPVQIYLRCFMKEYSRGDN